MDEIGEFEKLVRDAFDPDPSIIQKDKVSALNNVHEMNESNDSLKWCVLNYTKFSSFSAKKLVLIICSNYCRNRWDINDTEMIEIMKDFLFGQIIVGFSDESNDIRSMISLAQCSFMWNAYTVFWFSFWTDLLGCDDSIVINFLDSFCSLTSTSPFDQNSSFYQIKSQMRIDKSDQLITEYVLLRISNGDTVLCGIISELFRWVSLDYIISYPVITLVLECLDNKDTLPIGLAALASLMERGMQHNDKIVLVETIGITHRIIPLICRDSDPITLYNAAKIIESAGSFFLESKQSVEYFQIAVALITNPNNEIAGCVISFIQQYIKVYPGYVSCVRNNAFFRIKLYFETNEEPDTPFIELFFSLIRTCFHLDTNGSFEYIVSMCESMEVMGELPLSIAILHILYDHSSSLIEVDLLLKLVGCFDCLLFVPDSPSSYYYNAVSSFLMFISSIGFHIDDSYLSDVFYTVSNCVLNGSINKSDLNSLSSSLAFFVKKLVSKISFDFNMICDFVYQMDKDLVKIAARLLSSVPIDEASDIILHCIVFFEEKIKSIVDRGQSCLCALHFLHSLRCSKDNRIASKLIEFLQNMSPFTEGIDEYKALFIRTCYSLLGSESMSLISNCTIDKSNRHTVAALSEVIAALAITTEQPQWALSFVSSIFSVVQEIIASFDPIDIINEDLQAVSSVISKFFDLIKSVIHCIDSALLLSIVNFLNALLVRYFKTPLILEISFNLLSYLSKTLSVGIIEPCANNLFSFITSSSFHPSIPSWNRVCYSSLKFFSNIHKISPDFAESILIKALSYQGANPDLINSFNTIIPLNRRNRSEFGIGLFIELSKLHKYLIIE